MDIKNSLTPLRIENAQSALSCAESSSLCNCVKTAPFASLGGVLSERRCKMWFLIWIQVFSLVLIFSVWLLPAIFSGWINLNIYLQICFGTLISTFIIEFVTMQPILRLAKHYNFIEK